MLGKIKAFPEKVAFSIGVSLLLLSPITLHLLSLLIPQGIWKGFSQAIAWFFGILFILSASDKRHGRLGKGK